MELRGQTYCPLVMDFGFDFWSSMKTQAHIPATTEMYAYMRTVHVVGG
jgi:hypothetical protein